MILVKKINFNKKNNFNKIIFFSSNWCFPCKKIKKNINKINNKILILFYIIDIEKYQNYCINLNIKIIPTIKIIYNKIIELNGFFSIKNILKKILN